MGVKKEKLFTPFLGDPVPDLTADPGPGPDLDPKSPGHETGSPVATGSPAATGSLGLGLVGPAKENPIQIRPQVHLVTKKINFEKKCKKYSAR